MATFYKSKKQNSNDRVEKWYRMNIPNRFVLVRVDCYCSIQHNSFVSCNKGSEKPLMHHVKESLLTVVFFLFPSGEDLRGSAQQRRGGG